jgi:hypothetical protein
LGKEDRTLGGAAIRSAIAKHVTKSVFARIRHRVRRTMSVFRFQRFQPSGQERPE